MALVPRSFFRNWWDDIDRYHRELDDHFQQLTTTTDVWRPAPMPSLKGILRPWRNIVKEVENEVDTGVATVERDHDKYRVILDVQQFAPEEIIVRTDDKFITVEGKHEDKKDSHGYVSRQFVRRYALPKGYDIGHVTPRLSSDGILTITAPRLVLPAPGERIIPIQRSYIPAIKGM